jgi:YD repeat-containing protein
MAVATVMGIVGILVALHARVISTPAYKQAIELAKSSRQVQTLLGDGIAVKLPVIGWVESGDGSEFVAFSATIAGSRGRGHLYGVANAIYDNWEFSRLSFVPDREQQKIDLAPTPSRPYLPSVPAKKVYLIPVGMNEPLDWAPAYYKAKLGIDIQLLPATPLDQTLIDSQRQQVDSERFIEYLGQRYSDLAADPASILIGVTSSDIFIRSFDWSYAENLRNDARFAVVSSARFHPLRPFDHSNPEWLTSRFQKMLTKNIAILYFGLPMSNDYTSLLSGGVLSGREVDLMGGALIGAEGRWDPFFNEGDVLVSISAVPGKPPIWRMEGLQEVHPDTSTRIFNADLTVGLFAYRKTDFRFDGDYPLQFTRAYRNQDNYQRPFGLGANDSMDIFLIGQLGVYIDLLLEDGGRIHFLHVPPAAGQKGDTYQAGVHSGSPFSRSRVVFSGSDWTIYRPDGWKFIFPYRPKYGGANVTVLTGFSDPSGHVYQMVRDSTSGDLLSVTTPAGQWLHFERDAQHHVHSISDSSGRTVTYEYDPRGCLTRVLDSDGDEERYTFDDKAQMLTVSFGSGAPILTNTYNVSGDLETQTMSDGKKFEYHYVRDRNASGRGFVPDLITSPNGLVTHILYSYGGYTQSLPTTPPG